MGHRRKRSYLRDVVREWHRRGPGPVTRVLGRSRRELATLPHFFSSNSTVVVLVRLSRLWWRAYRIHPSFGSQFALTHLPKPAQVIQRDEEK